MIILYKTIPFSPRDHEEGLLYTGNLLGSYRKIPKISPGAYVFQRPFLRGLPMEGNVRFKIDWASLIVFEGNFQVQAPGGGGG